MKCPWITTTKQYVSYEEDLKSGKPVTVIDQTLGECVGEECPFYGNLDHREGVCFRTYRRNQ